MMIEVWVNEMHFYVTDIYEICAVTGEILFHYQIMEYDDWEAEEYVYSLRE